MLSNNSIPELDIRDFGISKTVLYDFLTVWRGRLLYFSYLKKELRLREMVSCYLSILKPWLPGSAQLAPLLCSFSFLPLLLNCAHKIPQE